MGGRDIVGKAYLEAFPELVGTPLAEVLDRVYQRGESFVTHEYHIPLDRTGSGTLEDCFYTFCLEPLRDAGGAVYGMMAVAVDITEQVNARRILENATAEREKLLLELESANQAKDEFLATVSHELRTPLTAILGWSRLLSGSVDGARIAQGLAVIERKARAQAQLIEDILDVSRIISGKLRVNMRSVEPTAVVNAAAETVRPTAKAKQIRLTVDMAAALPPLVCDEDRLQQIVWNLLSNALRFTPPGGEVTLRAEARDSRLIISVRDTGQGIAAEFLPRVFNRFWQDDTSTTKQHAGLGLGLSIVHHLVELHGGSVTAHSDGAGRGATFTVSLPVEPPRDLERALTPPPASVERRDIGQRLRGAHVLVVDDQDDARQMVVAVLERAGARVTEAASVAAAMEMLESSSASVIVSDIAMPGEDGYSFMQRVRARNLPAVALTAYARPEDRQKALDAGFREHVAKPVDPHHLIDVVRSSRGLDAPRREAHGMGPIVSIPRYRAQLASLAEHPPTGSQWLHELRYDGHRIGCFVEGGSVRVESRRNEDWTAQLPEIALAAKRLPVSAALLDGELAVVLPDGTTDLQALRRALAGASRQGLTFFVFDLLHLDGRGLKALPLEQRKELCKALLCGQEAGSPIRYAEHFDIDGAKLLARACALGASGIVSKRRDQAYRPGGNAGWLESTCSKRQEPVAARRARQGALDVSGVTITTPTRPVYPALGFTKLDLAQFYSDIADWMLPYIESRPLTLVRCERGVSSVDALWQQCKFLPHEPAWYRWASDPIRRIQIQEQKKVGEYLYVDSRDGLIALAQGDIIEIHAWAARIDRLEQPDRIIFDLDPGDDVAWPAVVEAAVALRDALALFGLQSWPKLTGGKGVHVVLPFEPEHGWKEVYELAHRLAELFVQRHPESLTLGFAKQGRSGKILVDYKRNHRAAVAVAAYSTRARPSGAVGVPLSWRELSVSRVPDRWTVQNVRQRLKRLRADPWRDFWTVRQRLARPSP